MTNGGIRSCLQFVIKLAHKVHLVDTKLS